GKSFTTRRVVAIQHGKAIFNLAASFHADEPGIDHSEPMPDAPDPDRLPTFHERMAPWQRQLGDWYTRPRPIDTRHVQPPWWGSGNDVDNPPEQQVWFRADGALPDDPLLHACVVAYASDMTLLDSVLRPHRLNWVEGNLMMASLDHAMWFHREFRADDWLLYDQRSPSAHGARGLGMGSIFTRDGKLAVSVVQEGLVRVIKSGGD
ncbi:MAG TPA: acyl-CoA thioesterase II, partial [Acidimicrobiales bacterium]|nr:acyl-CoA thioesterase II [Acidimicrobiales bacterium]